MLEIDWDEFKEFKLYSVRSDNFDVLLDFLKSYYNITNPYDMFDVLIEDEITKRMLAKRTIDDVSSLIDYMQKI